VIFDESRFFVIVFPVIKTGNEKQITRARDFGFIIA